MNCECGDTHCIRCGWCLADKPWPSWAVPVAFVVLCVVFLVGAWYGCRLAGLKP
jgi:hypothetical protein